MKAKRKDNNFIKVIHHKFLIIKKAVFKGTDMTKYFKGAYKILMLGEGHCFRDQILSSCPACFSANEPNRYYVEGSSLETIRHMVASGMGLTILPMTAAYVGPYDEKILVTRPLKGVNPSRFVALAWRRTYPRIQAIEKILAAIAQCKI